MKTLSPNAVTPAELEQLESLLETERPCLRGREGFDLPLPDPIFHILLNIVQGMKNGRTMTLVPEDETLTTQAAADLLGVSRPYLVRLLEGGKLPFFKVGSHRKVKLTDLKAFKQERDAARRQALDSVFDKMDEAGLVDDLE